MTENGILAKDGDVLVTQGLLHRLAGSEVVVLELCEYFASMGRRVVVVARSFGEEFVSEHLALPGVEVIAADDPMLADRLKNYEFTLAWIQHNVTPAVLFSPHAPKTVIFAHLSPFLAAEMALVPGLERGMAAAVVFNSPETRDAHRNAGLYDGFPEERLLVFPNPAPDGFARVQRGSLDGDRPRLLVVSNHLPDEMREALSLLVDDAEIAVVGAQREYGALARRVDPALLAHVDAVISIGKTVQYALNAGRGVYCYDVHGGPGWLDEENLEQSAALNFSGRGFSKRSGVEIAEEVRAGWRRALDFSGSYRATAIERFGLSSCMKALAGSIGAMKLPLEGVDGDIAASAVQLDRRLTQLAVRENGWFSEREAHKRAVTSVRSLTRERDHAVQECDVLRADRGRVQRELDDLAGRFREVVVLREGLIASLEERGLSVARLHDELERKAASIANVKHLHRQDIAGLVRARAELDQMRNSWSWKVTAPLRTALRYLKSARVALVGVFLRR
ncbi:glycosyltransferase [Xylanimonas cellulosilytica]|uniref:glycosyltransferase n=1 Tax=Xylanimonas cellulosilytica TaxID=186189 RepID=UPI001651244B|nr:glycosyltransferase [Xylanimonas cellulosilytica]